MDIGVKKRDTSLPALDLTQSVQTTSGMNRGGSNLNFQNTFDRSCNEIRMEIQTVNIFGNLISTRLIEIVFWYKEKSYEKK